MSSRTMKRGAAPRRTVNRRRAPSKQAFGDRLIAKLPFGHETLRRIVTWSLLIGGGAAVVAAANWAGIPQRVGIAAAETAADAGLRVRQVDITGLKRMDRDTVYALVFDGQPSRAMLRIDLAAVRDRLLRQGWVEDAYVSRRLPDRLLVHITEREPAAVWQDQGRLTLIDKSGVLLETIDRSQMNGLPLMIGPGADRQEASYQALLAAAPALRPRVTAAFWTANRRWDLQFDTGERLMLPQDAPEQALVKFAEMDGATPLLGRGWIRFDMRVPDRMYARKPDGALRHEIDDNGRASPAPATANDGDSHESQARVTKPVSTDEA